MSCWRFDFLNFIKEWWKSTVNLDARKVVNITCLFKKGDRDNLADYRDTSLLPVAYKMYRTLINKRLQANFYVSLLQNKGIFGREGLISVTFVLCQIKKKCNYWYI